MRRLAGVLGGATSALALSLVVATQVHGCADPRDGGIVAEIRQFEDDLWDRSYRACGVDTTKEYYVLDLTADEMFCHRRLGWLFNSCEREALSHYPEAARAHFKARDRYHYAVISCCEDGGPDDRTNTPSEVCTGPIVDACIDDLNAHETPPGNGGSYGLEQYFKEDNLIAAEVEQCLEANGGSNTAMLPRTCGKVAVCPRP